MSSMWPYVAGIVPTILVATLFYFLIKSMIEGDRRERLAQSRFEREQSRFEKEQDAAPSVRQREPSSEEGPEDRDPESPRNPSPEI